MDRPDDYDLYIEEGMQAEEARYYEEMEYSNYVQSIELALEQLETMVSDASETHTMAGFLQVRDNAVTLRNALLKQIPIKGIPYNSSMNHNFVECCVCNKDMYMYYKYCPHCGQKLDWS